MIHKSADVKSESIGEDTYIWQFCVIFKGAVIGDNCNICANVLIENKVNIGNNVIIKSGVQIWDGVTIGDNVHIGPNVTFTNDYVPRSLDRESGKSSVYKCVPTVVESGATLGANSTIIAGNTIGKYAFIGAGSVVTKDIPANTVWYGNPAKHRGFITNSGILLDMSKKDQDGNERSLYE